MSRAIASRARPRSSKSYQLSPLSSCADVSVGDEQLKFTHVPQMPSIQSWRRGGGTFERGVGSGTQDARGIADGHGRLMVVMLHNTDVPDGWEREGEDREYFLKFSPDAYSVGIDIELYGMTH